MKTIFIGPCGGGKVPQNGASIKNYHITNQLKEYITDLTIIDTENWKGNPNVLFKIISTILFYKGKSRYILSLNSSSANKLIRLIQTIDSKAEIIYWVIGGSFAKRLKNKQWDKIPYLRLRNIIVEGKSMQDDLNSINLDNVTTLPNFKEIPDIHTHLKKKHSSSILKFIFISRIIPQKGCNLIIEAVKKLNAMGYTSKFEVDFYGPIDKTYEPIFMSKIKDHSNLQYKGFIDLRDSSNYEIIANYDSMLFPTYWYGEGCPGVVIDAYIANLPVLASDWNLNADYIINDITGHLFKAKDMDALTETLKYYIHNPSKLNNLRQNITSYLTNYDVNTVLSEENLKKYGLIN